MTYREAIEYLYSVRLFGTKLGLANTEHLLKELGHPEDRFFTVHVAGTNGKGSVCALISSILSAAGYKAGMFTSPHILSFRERIRVGQAMIPEEGVCYHLLRLLPIIEDMAENPEVSHPTFFEIVTALAVDYFAASDVQVAVVETGMGGRLDATNVLSSKIEIITAIGLEHTAYLGSSIAEIASEKAGIIKEGATVIMGERDEKVVEVIRRKAREKRARLLCLGEDIGFRNREAEVPVQRLDIVGSNVTYPGIVLPLLGEHQAENCCLAVAAVEQLQRRGFAIGEDKIYQGIRQTRWPGRLEVIPGRPNYILDAACNPHACQALAETLSEVIKGTASRKSFAPLAPWREKQDGAPPKSRRSGKRPKDAKKGGALTLIVGFLRDKDYRRMCEILFPLAENIILTEPKSQRALPVEELREMALLVVQGKAESRQSFRQDEGEQQELGAFSALARGAARSKHIGKKQRSKEAGGVDPHCRVSPSEKEHVGEIRCFDTVDDAIAYASGLCSSGESFVCITGSNYLLGPARKALGLDDLPDDFVLSESFGGDDRTTAAP